MLAVLIGPAIGTIVGFIMNALLLGRYLLFTVICIFFISGMYQLFLIKTRFKCPSCGKGLFSVSGYAWLFKPESCRHCDSDVWKL